MEPPLTLKVEALSPHTILPSDHSPFDFSPVPSEPSPPWTPPSGWTLSPTHNYPSPYGTVSLGGVFSAKIALSNHTDTPVLGVKMMLEVQGPGGRYRLGEIIHGQKDDAPSTPTQESAPGEPKEGVSEGQDVGEKQAPPEEVAEESPAPAPAPAPASEFPELAPGEATGLQVEMEMKELGLQVLICSVAWETPEGRRTFQRFLKFNVNPPLSIKTRIHTPLSPNATLDPERRGDVHLEVLMQNTSPEGLLFDRVLLEPVHGMTSRRITAGEVSNPENLGFKESMSTLLPNDSRQYLFILSPSASTAEDTSVFPPSFPGGTVLPLGRLDVAWRSGRYHDQGRLQTSTLNRRVPVTPIAPKAGPAPTRTSSAIPPSPAGPSRVVPPSPTPPPLPTKEDEERWEFDLSVMSLARDGVVADSEFEAKLRLGVRKANTSSGIANASANTEDAEVGSSAKPGPVFLAIQYITPPPLPPGPTTPATGAPQTVISPPSRSNTPQPASRPFSPGTSSSRPLTPVSSQLRQATTSQMARPSTPLIAPPPPPLAAPFPPPPTLSKAPTSHAKRLSTDAAGEVYPLGSSLFTLSPPEWTLVKEQHETTYSDAEEEPAKRWEALYDFPLRCLALEEGLAQLGGLRVLVLEDESGLKGYVGREWDSLGDIWVTS